MKKVSAILKVFMAALLTTGVLMSATSAEEFAGTELTLSSKNSGFKIIIPGYIGVRTVTADGRSFPVTSVEMPQKDKNGKYPIFEIVTTNINAFSVKSYPGIMHEGQSGTFESRFNQGRLIYAPSFSFGKELKDIAGQQVFSLDFKVYDKNGKAIFSISELNFQFVNSTAVSAKPIASCVTVDGKQIAFEAYSVNGSSWFKLRDLAMALNGTGKQFQVNWDAAGNAVKLTSKTAYTPSGNDLAVSGDQKPASAKPAGSKLYLDGREIRLSSYIIRGSSYFKLRDIGKLIDFDVTWNGSLNIITINTSAGYSG